MIESALYMRVVLLLGVNSILSKTSEKLFTDPNVERPLPKEAAEEVS